MKRWNRKIAPIFIEKFVKNQKFFSYWCQSREGVRRTMTFSELVISLTLSTFSKCFSWWCWRGLLAFLCEEGELTSQNVKVLSCFTENPFYIPYIWDFHWKPPGPGFEKSGMSLEIFALSLFQSRCQSLALQAQTRRGISPSRTSVMPSPLDGRAPPNVQSSCLLCWLLSRKRESPQPSLSCRCEEYRRGGFATWLSELTQAVSAGGLSRLWWCDLSSCTCPSVPS